MPNIEAIQNQLTKIEIPEGFSSRERAQETVRGVYSENLTIPELEQLKLTEIHRLLSHPKLDDLISRGHITYGMIKPNASEGVGLPENDDEAANVVLQEMGKNVVFSLPFQFTKGDATKFYGHLEEKFKDKPEIYEEIIDFITASGLTAVLLYKRDAGSIHSLGEGKAFDDGSRLFPNGKLSTRDGNIIQLSNDQVAFFKNGKPVVKELSKMDDKEKEEFEGRRVYYVEDGQVKVKIENAVIWWRDKMGDTKPEDAKINNPESIRAKHAATLPNNITHGSDSIESVKREVKILDEAIENLIEKVKLLS